MQSLPPYDGSTAEPHKKILDILLNDCSGDVPDELFHKIRTEYVPSLGAVTGDTYGEGILSGYSCMISLWVLLGYSEDMKPESNSVAISAILARMEHVFFSVLDQVMLGRDAATCPRLAELSAQLLMKPTYGITTFMHILGANIFQAVEELVENLVTDGRQKEHLTHVALHCTAIRLAHYLLLNSDSTHMARMLAGPGAENFKSMITGKQYNPKYVQS